MTDARYSITDLCYNLDHIKTERTLVKVTSQLLENRQASLTIEVEDERVQRALQSAARRLANRLNIPGFRKGKAPYQVVFRTVGEEGLYEEAIDELGQSVYREALEQSGLDPFGPGQMDDVQLKPLVFRMTVPLRPTVDLGDYRSVRVLYTPPEVTEEAIGGVLKGLQERHTMLEPAGEGPAEMGQVAVLTIEGRLNPQDESPTYMHEHDINLLLAEGTDFPFPDFFPHIVGMKTGEDRSFEMVVPETDEDAEMRGKTVYFNVKLEDLKVQVVPPLDDAFAQTVGDYETLEALRTAVRASLLQQATQEAESKYIDECLRKLVEQAAVEFPPLMVEQELDNIIERTEQRLKDQKMSLDEFLNIKKQTREAYRAELRPRAESNIRRGLVLSELAVREGLKVSGDELTVAINMISAGYGEKADQVRESLGSDEGRQSLSASLLTDKVTARLMSICKGENPPLPSDEQTEPVQQADNSSAAVEPAVESN
jgi:trigger factor